MSESYALSGKFGRSVILLPLTSITGSLILGAAYGLVNVYNPLLYVQFFLIAMLGVAVGWLVDRAAQITKCRNVALVGILGGIAGLMALYAAWVSFVAALWFQNGIRINPLLLFSNPAVVFSEAVRLCGTGWYSLAGATPTGLSLALLWLVEAVVIVGIAFVWPLWRMRDHVFCEACGEWCRKAGETPRRVFSRNPEISSRIRRGELDALVALESSTARVGMFYEVEHYLCPKCGNFGVYEIQQVNRYRDKEGKYTITAIKFSPKIILKPEHIKVLGLLLAKTPMPAKPARIKGSGFKVE